MKNLLLLGDSIRMGYDSFVKEKLEGRMNVFFFRRQRAVRRVYTADAQ